MLARLKLWYKKLTPLQKIGLLFLFNCFIWLAGSLIGDLVFFEEKRSLSYHIINAAPMAVCTTIFFSWTTLRLVFRK